LPVAIAGILVTAAVRGGTGRTSDGRPGVSAARRRRM